MWCDIHIWAERKTANGYDVVKGVQFAEGSAPFDWRSYGMFGFLADVRNYSDVPPLAARRDFPDDASHEVAENYDSWSGDAHSASWLSVAELVAFDYDGPVEDRRVTRQLAHNLWSGGETADPGEGKMMTWREFLGDQFMADLEALKACDADRVVFWFDN